MFDPVSPLFSAHGAVTADLMPRAADPASAHAVMVVGVVIIVSIALWSLGGLVAAIWTRVSAERDRRIHRGVHLPDGRHVG